MTTDDRAEPLVAGEQLGGDLAAQVQAGQELDLVVAQWEQPGQQLPAGVGQGPGPRLHLGTRRSVGPSKHRDEPGADLGRVSPDVVEGDLAPVPPAQTAVDDECEAQALRVEPARAQQVASVEQVSPGIAVEQRSELASRELVDVEQGNLGGTAAPNRA